MIQAVMFDMGGTLEDLYSDEKNNKATAYALYDILKKHGLEVPYEAEPLWDIVGARIQAYKKNSEKTLIELKPEEIWCDWGFKDIDIDKQKLAEISEEIAHMWEITYYHRVLRPRVAEMLGELRAMGMKLGIISNTAALFQVFDSLEAYGIRDCFRDVTLSSVTGLRKPCGDIFTVSLRQMQSRPEECVYVGDTVSRDVIGSKRAGFAVAIQIQSKLTREKDRRAEGAMAADFVISDIYQVAEVVRGLTRA